ncbi:MAG: phosphoketolase family protein [Bacilli bacterium]|nr:phosphoketolase family protein [Bacilli bacterium]
MKTLNKKMLMDIDAYFRASNYLAVGQLYLLDNPLLKEELKLEHIKRKLVGHWGTVPGQNFIYTHLNRVINKFNLDMLYVSGPGHGGNAMVAHSYLEGSYSKVYPNITEDIEGMKKLFKQFSFPGGISSHVAPETPGSINEGGELGYSLAHSYGAVLDNKDLIVACVVGDGEAETGPLATSWHSNKFINPIKDGAVLPILHLNGFKISNPTVFARMTDREIESFFTGLGYEVNFVEGSNPMIMHEKMATALDKCIIKILDIQRKARNGKKVKPVWPMIVLKTPKGWTGPKAVENSFKAHQIPLQIDEKNIQNIKELEKWMKSYKPEELFDENGKFLEKYNYLKPKRPMGLNKHANGGLLLKDLKVPDFKKYGIPVERGVTEAQDMMELGKYVRDVIKLNPDNFRIFGPDEAMSNRLNYAFEETNRQWALRISDKDEFISHEGRIIDSYLSEHMCQGWLEGYLLTGRHGFIHSYEAFIRIVDSMASQHAKWLKVTSELPWREPIASLNYVLTSHVWQQDHNGFTHQDPGFLNHLVTKKADVTRIYLPFDANSLLSCFDHCIQSKNYINVVVASKHPRQQWMNITEASEHCKKGIGVFDFASNDDGNPDLVLACCGDTPTLEILGAVTILRQNIKDIKIRVINIVDLMKLQSDKQHPHGLSDDEYNELFTISKPIIFAFHGYPNLIHQLVYKRVNTNLHVHGYHEEGTITTPFDMRVQNKLDRYHLVISALKYLPQFKEGEALTKWCLEQIEEHNRYIKENGIDMPAILNFNFNEEMKKTVN